MDQKIIIIAAMAIIGLIGIVIYMNYQAPTPAGEIKITDMADRSLNIPEKVNKTFSLAGSLTTCLYMIAPDKMVGWNSNNQTKGQYMNETYKKLPILGGGMQNANYEQIIAQNPDVIFMGHGKDNNSINDMQQKFGEIPVIDLEGDIILTNITPSIKFMGKVLGEENKSQELVNFYNKVYQNVTSTVSTIPDSQKKKVYYTKSADGLTTFAPGSPQVQLIEICGGKNVVESPVTKGGMGVSMELILDWNPDVIITSDSQFYQNVYSDSTWANINAVKNKQVYLQPSSPFNWFENPPGTNTIIGIPWTAKVLYPDKFQDLDLNSLTKEFYSKFYHYNLTDSDVSNILSSSGLNQS
ncbi:MAG: iron ABC transporter substrate-binding protein [Methanobacteriales archaeon HGW-Methanobacteriales-1]|jgi:iron complex transport system substrate-binding protein|nr:MAG: iron ABC transporter substrate-binding protein [Methanobacteriales archaeon HGW-Methanobacteriales-1]